MGRPALTDEQIEEQRTHLVRAAERLFAERGYEGVTLRALAEALDRSPTAAYRYFDGKAAIFTAARIAAYERFADVQERTSRAYTDPAERLTNLGDAYVQFALDDPDGYRLMFELKPPPGDESPDLRAAGDRAFEPLQNALAAAVDAGLMVGDATTLAHLFWAGLHGVVSLHLAGKLSYGLTLADLQVPMKRLLVAGVRHAWEPLE